MSDDAQARVDEAAALLGGDTPDQPDDETGAPDESGTGAPEEKPDETPEAPEQDAPEADEDDFELDLDRIPEDPSEARKWIAQREREMQGLLTKKTQALAEQRKQAEQALALMEAFQNPEKHPELLKALGYELDADDDEGDFEDDDDTPDFRDPRLDQLLEQMQAREAQEAHLADIETQFTELQAEIGREFDDEQEIQFIHDLATARADGNRLDIKGAYEAIQARDKALRKQYVQSKKAPAAPQGESAKHTPDLSTPRARADFVAEQLAARGD